MQHLKSPSCEIRCFCYFRSKIITTKNRSNIIINRENSLFVINTTTFLLSFDKQKGKASDIFQMYPLSLYQTFVLLSKSFHKLFYKTMNKIKKKSIQFYKQMVLKLIQFSRPFKLKNKLKKLQLDKVPRLVDINKKTLM